MSRYICLTIFVAFECASHLTIAQNPPPMDPEAMKIMQSYQEQNQKIPPEILGLMPPGLTITEKSWMVEASSKMLLQLSLKSFMGSTSLENSENYTLDLRIDMTAYNLESDVGKMTADQSLDIQRREVQNNWLNSHQESRTDEIDYYQPEASTIPHGVIQIQKIYAKAHLEGEGMVSEKTSYCGFLYMEMEAGYLTAEIQALPNTGTGIEKWLKYIAEAASKLNLKDYFK